MLSWRASCACVLSRFTVWTLASICSVFHSGETIVSFVSWALIASPFAKTPEETLACINTKAGWRCPQDNSVSSHAVTSSRHCEHTVTCYDSFKTQKLGTIFLNNNSGHLAMVCQLSACIATVTLMRAALSCSKMLLLLCVILHVKMGLYISSIA